MRAFLPLLSLGKESAETGVPGHRVLVLLASLVVFAAVSCRNIPPSGDGALPPGNYYAHFFEVIPGGVVTISPYGDGKRDTLMVPDGGVRKIVCMSSSYIGYLEAIGEVGKVCAVSGKGFISCEDIVSDPEVYDVGYDAELDYERILSLHPDVLLTYNVGEVGAPYIQRLRSLGIRVMVLSEHLEENPLSRSEYVRFFGALTGKAAEADSAFRKVESNYLALRKSVDRDAAPVRVLINAPYSDQWYIPGGDSYMTTLIKDAGGEVLGAREGTAQSSIISLEDAFILSSKADVWLHPSSCRTREQIRSLNPMFTKFDIPFIYNNTRRVTPAGGNDFWESGAFRCDLILSDLVSIISGCTSPERAVSPSFEYYLEVK